MKKKTHDEYIQEVKGINKNIKVVGKYDGANKKILHKCLIDGYEWYVTPHNILKGRSCPKCSNSIRRTHDEYVSELAIKNPTLEVVDKFINTQTEIMHHCLIHDIYWMLRPSHALNGVKCRECQKDILREERAKTKNDYVNDLKTLNPNIIVIGDYINAHIPILHKCAVCGCEWYAKPNNILSYKGCPKCAESSGEKKVALWLKCHNIKYVSQKTFDNCKDIRPLPFDFYLPKHNTCIEYQGEQHYKPIRFFGGEDKFKIQQKHDRIKREYCKNNNIILLEIPYFKNIEEELNNFLFN